MRGWVELLVVCAILAALAVFCQPFLAAARSRGAAGRCMANIRQIGAATRLYLADHDETFPIAWGTGVPVPWIQALAPYLGAKAPRGDRAPDWARRLPPLHCPADDQGPAPVSYATNALIAGAVWGATVLPPERLGTIEHPAQVVWVGDTNKLWNRRAHFYDSPTDWVRPEVDLGYPKDDTRSVSFYRRWLKARDWTDLQAPPLDCPDGLFQCKYPAFRHDRIGPRTGFATFLFVDGHARTYRWGKLKVENLFPRLTARQRELFNW